LFLLLYRYIVTGYFKDNVCANVSNGESEAQWFLVIDSPLDVYYMVLYRTSLIVYRDECEVVLLASLFNNT